MNTIIDPTVVCSAEKAYSKAAKVYPIQPPRPSTIVLQPHGPLNEISGPILQRDLEKALTDVTDAVIVDLLWVDSVTAEGIAALVASIQQATALGKFLSFQSMDNRTRASITTECDRQRQQQLGPWTSLFKQDLENFLDQLG